MRSGWKTKVSVGVIAVALVSGYVVADAYDVVPGPLTVREPDPDPNPYPELALPEGTRVAPVVDGFDNESPQQDPEQIDAIVDTFLSEPRLEGGASIDIRDAETGDILADHDADTPRSPASTIKMISGAVALSALGSETTLTTRTVTGSDGVVHLVAAGDTLMTEGEPNLDSVNGRASLLELAEQTAQSLEDAGVTEIDLVLDDTMFHGPVYGPDVHEGDRDWVMATVPLAINGGQRDDQWITDAPLDAASVLADHLRDQDITVAEAINRGQAPEEAEELGAVDSATVGEIVQLMMRPSDNSLSEVLTRLTALERGLEGTHDDAMIAMDEELNAMGIDTEGFSPTDSSGLSETNRVTATTLSELLYQSMHDDGGAQALVGTLPVANLDGTLSDRLPGETAGRVRAKTGTLHSVISLSGTVMTVDERLLAFTVVVSDITPGYNLDARLHIDEMVTSLANCGCAE